MPRPILYWLRSADGWAKRIAAAENAIDRTVNMMDDGAVDGAVARKAEIRTVHIDMTTPAARVRLTSLTDDTIEGAVARAHGGRPVSGVVGVTVFECCAEDGDMRVYGSGGEMKMTEHARARYPTSKSVKAALNVIPAKSNRAASSSTATDATRDFSMCCHSCHDGLWGESALFRPDAMATSSTTPVRMPPICVEA